MTYEASCPLRPELGFAFFGFNALRFIVAVIADLTFVLAFAFADLNGVSDASVRSLPNKEPPLKSGPFATNEPHAVLNQTVWNAGSTPRDTKRYVVTRDLDKPYTRH
jgi:hypothetical protein